MEGIAELNRANFLDLAGSLVLLAGVLLTLVVRRRPAL
jgi:hypothetical protein